MTKKIFFFSWKISKFHFDDFDQFHFDHFDEIFFLFQKPDYSKYQRYETPVDDLYSQLFGTKFRRSSGDDPDAPNTFHKQSITSKAYYNTILPQSQKRPYLLLFYSDWCYTCVRIEPIWAQLSKDLEPVGFGVATVHTEHEKELTRKIGAKELPHVVLLIEERVIHYKNSQISAPKILEFVRRKFPYRLVEHLDDRTYEEFLEGWTDNRVRVLLFGKAKAVKLRYMTTAYKFRTRAKVSLYCLFFINICFYPIYMLRFIIENNFMTLSVIIRHKKIFLNRYLHSNHWRNI